MNSRKKELGFVVILLCFSNSSIAGLIAPGFSLSTLSPHNFDSSTALSLAFDPSGDLWASNGINLSTVPLDGSIGVSESLRPPIASNQATNDIVFDSSGNLYVSDFGTDMILRRPPGGSFSVFATGLNMVREMDFDNNGNLIVVGHNQGSPGPGYVKKISPSGVVTTIVGSIDSPWDVDVAPDGTIFVGTLFGDVFAVSDAGIVTPFASLPRPLLESLVVGPGGFLFAGTNNGSNNGSVLRISSSGSVDVLGENIGDGLPIELEFGPSGDLFLANFKVQGPHNNVIRITGDFDGDLPNSLDPVPEIPEPSTMAIWSLLGTLGSTSGSWRRRRRK